jgi:hypothetical protein
MARFGWAAVGLLGGLAIGWWAGSFTTACGPAECHASWDAIEAIGTWVGGLGTVAAVLFAARAFTSEERQRRQEQEARLQQLERRRDAKLERSEAEMKRIRAEAKLVTAAVVKDVTDVVNVRTVRVTLKNNANETPVFQVGGQLPGYGNLNTFHKVGGGQTVTLAVFGSAMGIPKGNLPRTVTGKARAKFYADLTETLVLTYEMNGRWWTRTGQNQPELSS